MSSVNHFSSRAHEKNLSAWLYILICSFMVSGNIYWRQFLCRTLGVTGCTRHSPNTQKACSLVDKYSRLWLIGPPGLGPMAARGTKCLGFMSSFLFLFYIILIAYKIHLFCLVENLIKGPKTIWLKRIIILANIYCELNSMLKSFSALSQSPTAHYSKYLFQYHR